MHWNLSSSSQGSKARKERYERLGNKAKLPVFMRSRECANTPPEPIKNWYTELIMSNTSNKPLEIKPMRKQDL